MTGPTSGISCNSQDLGPVQGCGIGGAQVFGNKDSGTLEECGSGSGGSNQIPEKPSGYVLQVGSPLPKVFILQLTEIIDVALSDSMQALLDVVPGSPHLGHHVVNKSLVL